MFGVCSLGNLSAWPDLSCFLSPLDTHDHLGKATKLWRGSQIQNPWVSFPHSWLGAIQRPLWETLRASCFPIQLSCPSILDIPSRDSGYIFLPASRAPGHISTRRLRHYLGRSLAVSMSHFLWDAIPPQYPVSLRQSYCSPQSSYSRTQDNHYLLCASRSRPPNRDLSHSDQAPASPYPPNYFGQERSRHNTMNAGSFGILEATMDDLRALAYPCWLRRSPISRPLHKLYSINQYYI